MEILTSVNPDAPYALAVSSERERRVAMRTLPHIAPIAKYLAKVRGITGYGKLLPDIDPCDGGVNARVVFLLEAPGAKAVASGFVSRNNPDQTAKNLCELLTGAGIARADTVIWNIVPWYVGDGKKIRPVTPSDIAEAKPYLPELITLLPRLEQIVFVGKKAQSAAATIHTLTPVPFAAIDHPSPQVFNIRPERRDRAAETLQKVVTSLNSATTTACTAPEPGV